jgi:hypothetical protein
MRGNYPEMIENALKKRGVWRQFERSMVHKTPVATILKDAENDKIAKAEQLSKQLAMKIKQHQDEL